MTFVTVRHSRQAMTDIMFLSGFSEIAGRYDAVLCDVWGVIHNGRKAFDAACNALVEYRAGGGRVCLITNAPVPKVQVLRYFEPLGVPDEAFDDCVSSGDATRAELRRRSGETVWLMGADEGFQGDRALWNGLGLTFGAPEAADVILCMGMDDNTNDDPQDYRERLQPGIDRQLPMLCANPDIKVRVGDRLIWCAGALAQIYEEMGGDVIYPGKPHAAIYRLAVERLTEMGSAPRRILCIGDSPATDLKGARLQGYDSLYVGTGLREHGDDFENETRGLLAEYDETATYAMTGLRWSRDRW